MTVRFSKYEGAGNDFILIDNREGAFKEDMRLIAALCNRHFGIGADGLMTLCGSLAADCVMRYFNADGSEGEMCGNGARCFALFAEHLGIGGEIKRFEAADGIHTARILSILESAGEIELSMIDVEAIKEGNRWWFLNTGVPHYVEFVKNLNRVDVISRGREIRYDTDRFPYGTNVNFVAVEGQGSISIRTYERGVENETLACGTGAVAAAIITNYAFQNDMTDYRVKVAGGELRVSFAHNPATQHYTDILLIGPARRVFGGELQINNF